MELQVNPVGAELTLPNDLRLVALNAEKLVEALTGSFHFESDRTHKLELTSVLLDHKSGEILLLDALSSDFL